MDRRRLVQRLVLFLFVVFIAGNIAFADDNGYLILPEYFTKMKIDAKKGNRIEKKISGLLQIQIQAKNSYLRQPSTERLNIMRKMGLKAEEVNKQLVYVHSKRKLSASQIASLNKIGVTVYEDSWIPPLENHSTGYVIASIPIDRLYDLARKTFVTRLETAEKAFLPKNDEASKSIKADKVWDSGYDGTGVRIAILDSGLDTTHKDIPTPVASKDYSNYPITDDTIENLVTFHGTHVTGSALGRGTQSIGKYKGMAYGADLIFLKIGDDSTGSAQTSAISAAIKAAIDTYKANIITMSYGGLGGYNDGSDEQSQAVDYAYSKGALVFIAAGNEADSAIHYSGTVTANSKTDFIKVDVAPTSQAYLAFYLNWFDGKGTSNSLDLDVYDANMASLSPIFIKFRESESSRGTESQLVYFNNYISGPATYFLKVKNNSNSNQFFHIYSVDEYTTFEIADPSYTVGSPATADNAIAVASYTTRNFWINYLGDTSSVKAIIGEISYFSSRGPRIDGRKKPDIATPGEWIISALDKIVIWTGGYDDYVIDENYMVSQGTSMACPIAAGAAALLMQANSSLKGNPDSVRNALFKTAGNEGEQDTTYGYGKMDILAALNAIKNVTPTPSPTFTYAPIPTVTPTPLPTPTHATTPTVTPTQEPKGKGSISGDVVDMDGNSIESVKIRLKGTNTKVFKQTTSDEDGLFEFLNLDADTYTIKAFKKGYKRAKQKITLQKGEESDIEIEMVERS